MRNQTPGVYLPIRLVSMQNIVNPYYHLHHQQYHRRQKHHSISTICQANTRLLADYQHQHFSRLITCLTYFASKLTLRPVPLGLFDSSQKYSPIQLPKYCSTTTTTTTLSKMSTEVSVPVPKSFFGKYKLITSDNFDNFLKEIGVGLMKRKLATTSYPTVEFGKDENDNFIFKSHTIIKTSETRFRLGEEFDEDRLDGKRVKSVVVADGNKIIQTQRDGNLEIKYIREFTNDSIKVTSIANDVKCLRVYKRVPE